MPGAGLRTYSLALALVLLDLPRLGLTDHEALLEGKLEGRELEEEHFARIVDGGGCQGRERDDGGVCDGGVGVKLLGHTTETLLVIRNTCVYDCVWIRICEHAWRVLKKSGWLLWAYLLVARSTEEEHTASPQSDLPSSQPFC